MPGERCLVRSINAANEGNYGARRYLKEKLQGTSRYPKPNVPGETEKCDRCLAVFRFNPGGVYLEMEGEVPCDRSDGARGGRHSYQARVDFQDLDS